MRPAMIRVPAFVLMATSAIFAHAACPDAAPGAAYSMAIEPSPGSCNTNEGCPNGPVTLAVEPVATGFFPPAEFDPGYTIQPCDVVEWNFGDGTTQSVTGSDRVTHEYPNPGNYTVQATVSNALGSTTLHRTNMVVATSPSRVSFVTGAVRVVHPGWQWVCSDCVEVREGVLTNITVMRSLDLSRSISAEAAMTIGTNAVRVPLTFGPGVTQKTFSVTLPDDQVYSGVRYSSLGFSQASGGTLTRMNVSPQPALVMIDDDPVPTMSIQPTVFIAEGDAELTRFLIPVHLTWPMGVDTRALSFYTEGSATHRDFYWGGGGPQFKAGETSGSIVAWVKGDRSPEPDKTFQVRIAPAGTESDPFFGTTISTVTILNDDAALVPARVKGTTAAPIKLTLDSGLPYSAPTTASFTTNKPDVAPPPAPVVIPPGTRKIEVVVNAIGTGVVQIGVVLPGRLAAPSEILVTGRRRRSAAH